MLDTRYLGHLVLQIVMQFRKDPSAIGRVAHFRASPIRSARRQSAGLPEQSAHSAHVTEYAYRLPLPASGPWLPLRSASMRNGYVLGIAAPAIGQALCAPHVAHHTVASISSHTPLQHLVPSCRSPAPLRACATAVQQTKPPAPWQCARTLGPSERTIGVPFSHRSP